MHRLLRPKPDRSKRSIAEVAVAVTVCYLVLGLCGAKGLARWATHLPDGELSAMLRALTHEHWRNASLLGLEQPGIGIERWFLQMQGAPKLMYPRSYAMEAAHRRRKNEQKLASVQASFPTSMGMEAIPAEFAGGSKHGPRVLVIGDSLMLTVGPVVKKDVEAKLGGLAWIKAKLGTGLARPDLFDWPVDLKRVVTATRFDAVVMMFGTNDSQDFYEEGELLGYGTEPWVRAYNKRLAALMSATCDSVQHGFWIGMPPMRDPVFARKMLRINAWAAHQVAAHPCMQYISTERLVGDQDGGFADYLQIQTHLEKVRMLDGIHVTAKGGTLISATLIDLLKGTLRVQAMVGP